MQSAVKRKAGKKTGGGGEGGHYLIYVSERVHARASSSLGFLRLQITPFGRTALKHYPPRHDTWLIFSFEPLRYIYL